MMNTRDLFKIVMRGGWNEVIQIYKGDPEAKKDRITRSGYTALHLAVSDGREDIVEDLIKVLLEGDHEELPTQNDAGDFINALSEGDHTAKEALAMQNDAGNTPLHIAASMGNVRMCKLIANVDSSLIGIKNNDGETPLFLTALHGKKDAFLCLHSFCPEVGRRTSYYCRRNDGNSILHCAIAGEYFDLAFQIIQLYEDLVDSINLEGSTPLHVLATKPSAFQSGSNFGRFQNMVYKILFVDKLEANETYREEKPIKNEQNSSCPQNYQMLVNFFHCVRKILKVVVASSIKSTIENSTSTIEKPEGSAHGQKEEEIPTIENPTTLTKEGEQKGVTKEGEQKRHQQKIQTREKDFLPPNYATCFGFVKVVYKAMLVVMGPGYGGVTNILDEKRKHTHGHSRFWMNSFKVLRCMSTKLLDRFPQELLTMSQKKN